MTKDPAAEMKRTLHDAMPVALRSLESLTSCSVLKQRNQAKKLLRQRLPNIRQAAKDATYSEADRLYMTDLAERIEGGAFQ